MEAGTLIVNLAWIIAIVAGVSVWWKYLKTLGKVDEVYRNAEYYALRNYLKDSKGIDLMKIELKERAEADILFGKAFKKKLENELLKDFFKEEETAKK